MIDEPKTLIPYDRREAISVRVAATMARVSERTIQNWCYVHRIGRRRGRGPWMISRVLLQMYLDNDKRALAAYHAGDLQNERVAQYFLRAGLKTPQCPQSQRGGSQE